MKCEYEGGASLIGEHDWVLVLRQDYTMLTGEYNTGKLLWACPCGEFKWTSYAEWEAARPKKTFDPVTVVDDKPAESPEEAERRREELQAWHKRQYEERKKRKRAEGHTVTVGPKFPRGSRLDEKP